MKIELGKRYKIKYADPKYPSDIYEGVGIIVENNPPEYEKGSYLVSLENDKEGITHGVFSAKHLIEELPHIPTKEVSEINNLKKWLKYIQDVPERNRLVDSGREDMVDVDELASFAKQALAGVNFNEWMGINEVDDSVAANNLLIATKKALGDKTIEQYFDEISD